MKKLFLFSLSTLVLIGSAAHASEFSKNCYAEAEASAVAFVKAKYRAPSAHGGVAVDGEGDDIHVQVQVNGRTVYVDIGVEQDANSCSLAKEKPEIIDCRE